MRVAVLFRGLARCDNYVLHPKRSKVLDGANLSQVDYRRCLDSFRSTFGDPSVFMHTHVTPGFVLEEWLRDYRPVRHAVSPVDPLSIHATKMSYREQSFLHSTLSVIDLFLRYLEETKERFDLIALTRYDLVYRVPVLSQAAGIARPLVISYLTPDQQPDTNLVFFRRLDALRAFAAQLRSRQPLAPRLPAWNAGYLLSERHHVRHNPLYQIDRQVSYDACTELAGRISRLFEQDQPAQLRLRQLSLAQLAGLLSEPGERGRERLLELLEERLRALPAAPALPLDCLDRPLPAKKPPPKAKRPVQAVPSQPARPGALHELPVHLYYLSADAKVARLLNAA